MRKKIILATIALFAIISVAVIAYNKSESNVQTPTKSKIISADMQSIGFPYVTKYRATGDSGSYNIINEDIVRKIIETGYFQNVTRGTIGYIYDAQNRKYNAHLTVTGLKNNIVTSLCFELTIDNNSFFVVQDPVTVQKSVVTYTCSSCSSCTMMYDGSNKPRDCYKGCNPCIFNRTETVQEGTSTSDDIALMSILVAILLAL